MNRFNLVEEKWIPVRFLDGTFDDLGICDTLLRSGEIAFIEDPSPLVVASLHRFLLAILYRAMEGPVDIVQAKALFVFGIPKEKILSYLDKWKHRFWLFDEKYPFYQVPTYEPKGKKGKKEWKPWTVLAAEHNADNAKVLFDHVMTGDAGSIPLKMAVRWLLASQAFALGGGNSDFGYVKTAPSATSVISIPYGKNLHDTLLFSLVPENREVLASDFPVWEREPPSVESLKGNNKRPADGYSDLFSWLSRAIKFNPDLEKDSVAELSFASGIGFVRSTITDPMLAYRVDKKWGMMPIQFEDRGFWNYFDSLLSDDVDLIPAVINHAARLTQNDELRAPCSLMVLGLINDQAKIESWRMERFIWPNGLADSQEIRNTIREFLRETKDAGRLLSFASDLFFLNLLEEEEKGKKKNKNIKKFSEAMPVISAYWSDMEIRFHEVLTQCNIDDDMENIRFYFLKTIHEVLKSAWDHHRIFVSTGDAKTIRALVRSEGPIMKKLKELNAEILKFKSHIEPKKEGA